MAPTIGFRRALGYLNRGQIANAVLVVQREPIPWAAAISTVPRVGALDRLVGRVRAKPWMTVAVVAGALLVAAWLGWAIHVASDEGVNEGIGVLVAWPALLVAMVLVALPLVGLYLLILRLSGESAPDEESAPATDEGQPSGEGEEAQATETG
jgi:hypothetical protein